MMLSLLAYVCLGLQSPSGEVPSVHRPKSLFEQVIGRATGQNGYEEYVRAAELLADGQSGKLLMWSPGSANRIGDLTTAELSREQLALAERELALAQELDKLGYLGVQQEVVKRYGRVYDLVKQGNAKNVFEPRKTIDVVTLFPELASFKQISRFLSSKAYVDFAKGNTIEGAQTLREGLIFSRKISSGVLISFLVGSACQAITLASYEEHLDRIPLPELERVSSLAETQVADTSPWTTAMRYEAALASESFEYVRKGALETEDPPEDPTELALYRQLRSMTPAQWNQLRDRYLAEVDRSISRQIAILQRPEKEWYQATDGKDDSDIGNEQSVQTLDELLLILIDSTLPISQQALNSYMMRRTQMRLLSLHAKVLAFQWRHHRLPASLEEAVDKEAIYDPLSDSGFSYEPQPNGTFRLYSKGRKETGVIELRYRRASPYDAGSKSDPPSPLDAGWRRGKLNLSQARNQ